MPAAERAFDALADGMGSTYPGSRSGRFRSWFRRPYPSRLAVGDALQGSTTGHASSRGENSVRLAVWRVLSAEELEVVSFYRCRPRFETVCDRYDDHHDDHHDEH
jgi:hypothetical protein